MNSVQRFQTKSRQCFRQLEARAAILFFLTGRKTQTWKRTLTSCFLSSFVKFRLKVSEENTTISLQIRDQGGHLIFSIDPKNTNLIEDVDILLLVKFRWIPFNGFRKEVDNVSANQGPGRPVFSYLPENTNLVEDVKILLPVKFLEIPFSGFRGEVENVKVNDGQTTHDGQCVVKIVHLSLRLRCTKTEYSQLLIHIPLKTPKQHIQSFNGLLANFRDRWSNEFSYKNQKSPCRECFFWLRIVDTRRLAFRNNKTKTNNRIPNEICLFSEENLRNG